MLSPQSLLTDGLIDQDSIDQGPGLLTHGILAPTDSLPNNGSLGFGSGSPSALDAGLQAALANQAKQQALQSQIPGSPAIATPGGGIVSLTSNSVPLGDSTLFIPNAGQLRIEPPLNSFGSFDKYNSSQEASQVSYTGADMRVFLEMSTSVATARRTTATGQTKFLVELVTISVSVHREKAQVRALGYINPKGFARGTRTIAGTMVLTQFNADILYRFLDYPSTSDLSKDSIYVKPDQLPPFDLLLVFSDEAGNASYRRMLGVELVTDGTVYSSQDMLTEQTLSYYATDFTPLLPLTRSSLINSTEARALVTSQRTIRDVRRANQAQAPLVAV